MPAMINYDGEKFGRLLVLETFKGKGTPERYYCRCICECGKTKNVRSSHLAWGRIRSCGCLRSELSKHRTKLLHETGQINNTKHGYSKTAIYARWMGMKERCYNPKHKAFNDYGGRGIKVCDRWLESFEDWLNDLG